MAINGYLQRWQREPDLTTAIPGASPNDLETSLTLTTSEMPRSFSSSPLIEAATPEVDAVPAKQIAVNGIGVLAQLRVPVGIATDQNGNIFVTAEDSSSPVSAGPVLLVYNPQGTQIAQIPIAPLISPVDVFGSNRITVDPSSGMVFTLSPNGLIQVLDISTQTIQPAFDLKSLPIRTDRVFDVARNTIADFTGSIQPTLSSYGDLAIFNNGNVLDFYVSGISAGQTFPFVVRVRFTSAGFDSAEVVVSSIASAAPNQGQPPGVAVNAQGLVLTTMPTPNANQTGNFNAIVTFPVDFSAQTGTGSFLPTFISPLDAASTGMTTDAAGNFYIATSATGTSAGGLNGSAAVLVLSPQLQLLSILTIPGQATLSGKDVAVSPGGDQIYLTVSDVAAIDPRGLNGAVIVFGITRSAALSQAQDPFQLDSVWTAEFA